MKFVVLGGCGTAGTDIIKDLIWEGSEDVEKVMIADFNVEKAKRLARELEDSRIEAQFIDVAARRKTLDLLKTVDVCVNNVPTLLGYQMDIFNGALEAGCPYIDLGGLGVVTKEQKKLHGEFVKKGVPAVLGMGSAPGMTNVVAKYCVGQLDKVEKVNVYAAKKYIGPESPVFVPPYNTLTLISEYADTNIQYIGGEAKEMPPLSGRQCIDLPEPFGSREFVHTSHSETATMPYAKGFKDKGIREATWRLSLFPHTDEVMKSLISVGFADKEPIKVNGVDVVPERFLQLLIDRNIAKNKGRIPPPSSRETEGYKVYSLYFAIGEGKRNGEKIKVTAEIFHRSDNKLSQTYGAFPKNVTSIGTSVVAQMLGRGEIPPGVWAPEECVDTAEFFEQLKKRHFKITVKEEREI